MSKIDCNLIRDLLPLYIDDVVSDETKIIIERHLLECDDCNTELTLLRKDCTVPLDIDTSSFKKVKKNLKLKKIYIALICISLTAIFCIMGFFFWRNNIGVPLSKLEHDARESQSIDSSYDVISATGDEIVSFLFYDEVKEKSIFSVYSKLSSPLSFGYIFSGGGAGHTGSGVFAWDYGYDEEISIASINESKISKMVIEDGEISTIHDVDSSEPFVFIVPKKPSEITFYDIDGIMISKITLFDDGTHWCEEFSQ